ncbi:PLP-dependent aminotransferase family protein [Trinickia caryophylli]|uniref:Transcriptional regulator, GntR family n=1 Tax=Trinickia caryophylli TaxID=28094 RepID=A0A1X7DII3_TRICW|nr:PLP-dependent aminotransferase family protein [Trinickia caryophylli]PMS12331.1 PLP-dependent aminotransferase family protein [Trinickia caryophylli]TRX16996.1 PLP-dependent aminotransferase family protein [Trinickia caryophylli]WQE12266.1 PLP-dependent aminotransferase family protein [Trinickia caryophylli]SMF15601.1 transcriptional regulator, GntR family [Trinickia caryophylli]GLU31592.1 GntR family transcriptional regulator [Trinickia caryophylli]
MFKLKLSRSRKNEGTLVDQIVASIKEELRHGTYPAGTALPSVRAFAKSHGLSTYTVSEAYQRLVSLGLLIARAGAGYRVAARPAAEPAAPAWNAPALNAAWLLSDVFADQSVPIKAGCGWIPNDWVNESGIQHALRVVSRVPGSRIGGYGHPYGLAILRELIAHSLRRYSLAVGTADVLLTQGVTQALDLVVRTLLRPGDTVVVEDPCYCNLLQILKVAFVDVVSVPRTENGIDCAQLEEIVKRHGPKGIFVNTVLQNPSGTSLTAQSAFRLLQIADREGLWIVEDDISRELAPPGAPCLAAMEGLQRVIYLSGFSKTITPAMRVGYIAANRDLVARFALTKMAVGLTSSEVTERAVANVLVDGHYERHTAHIRERLFNAHNRVTEAMAASGLEVFHRPNAGLFLWAKLPIRPEDSIAVASDALSQGIWLAPGSYFRPGERASEWFRFNAATSDVPALWDFMKGLAGHAAG